eukprot:m.20328 g.20328  ORF g.20328 m.20328 type:complete len:297 (+) comp27996_c0_seq2:156-1046(+)
MAEALPLLYFPHNPSLRFYCHACDSEIRISPMSEEELRCPKCNGEFLEQLDDPQSASSPADDDDDPPVPSLPSSPPPPPPAQAESHPATASNRRGNNGSENRFTAVITSVLESFTAPWSSSDPRASGSEPQRLNIRRTRIRARPSSSGRDGEAPSLLNSILSGIFGSSNQGGPRGLLGSLGNFFVLPGTGNMGDYVTSERGIDDIVTQLLNQLEGGAPPAKKEAIESIPLIAVPQSVVDRNGDCVVCQDKFQLHENVCELPVCNHLFHSDCILPWLKLHNTCPVCRVPLEEDFASK